MSDSRMTPAQRAYYEEGVAEGEQNVNELLENLVVAYDNCFDPDKKNTAHELQQALDAAKHHLLMPTSEAL